MLGKFDGNVIRNCHDERIAAAKAISKEDASQAAARDFKLHHYRPYG
jgi:hypothetical protein